MANRCAKCNELFFTACTDTHPIPPLPDGELLQHLIETHGTTQVEVARQAKIAESTISEVIAGKRKLSRIHIGKLARHFGVPHAAFSPDG